MHNFVDTTAYPRKYIRLVRLTTDFISRIGRSDAPKTIIRILCRRITGFDTKNSSPVLIWLVHIADLSDIVEVSCFTDQSGKFDAFCLYPEGTKLQFVNDQILPAADLRIRRSTGVDSLSDPADFIFRLVSFGIFKTLRTPQVSSYSNRSTVHRT